MDNRAARPGPSHNLNPASRPMPATKRLLTCFACAALMLTACSQEKSAAPAADKPAAAASSLVKPTDAAWLAKAIAAYPLTTCPVSGDKLTDMGKPLDYIYKQAGQPDRLVRFCCADCPPKFDKEPAKYLKMIDDALAAQAKK